MGKHETDISLMQKESKVCQYPQIPVDIDFANDLSPVSNTLEQWNYFFSD